MPNAIYPPRWQVVPPAKHPAVWRWAISVALVILLFVLLMVLVRPA